MFRPFARRRDDDRARSETGHLVDAYYIRDCDALFYFRGRLRPVAVASVPSVGCRALIKDAQNVTPLLLAFLAVDQPIKPATNALIPEPGVETFRELAVR